MGNRFEGWYFKHQKGPETLALIAGRAGDGAFLQAVTREGACRVRYPVSAYRRGKSLRLADCRFSRDGISLSVSGGDLELTGRLRYGGLSPVRGSIMGPFRFLPMQCRHEIVSMNHDVAGKIRLNGKEFDFTGGKGYIEGDSGRSFPKSYTWVQCNHFAGNCSIMASAAQIPFAWSWFWGCICVVWLDGVEYRLATYRGAQIKRRDEGQLLLVQKDLSLNVLFPHPPCGYALDAPNRGRMKRIVREAPCTTARFEFRRGDRVLFREESPFASYEYV